MGYPSSRVEVEKVKAKLMLLNVITPCIRPQNLPTILESILVSRADTPIHINWYIVSDGKVPLEDERYQSFIAAIPSLQDLSIILMSYEGNSSPRNKPMDAVESGLLFFLDDDTIMHRDYISHIYEAARDKDEIGILYHQSIKEAPSNAITRKVLAHKVIPENIDTGQITITKNLIGAVRWKAGPRFDVEDWVPYPDGIFIKELYQKHKKKFVILDKILSHYNFLAKPKHRAK